MPDFVCKLCGGVYEVSDEFVGESITCPGCDRDIVAGDEVKGARDTGSSAAARIVEERHAAKKSRPGYRMPMTWIAPLGVAIVVAVAAHLAMVAITLKMKPLPDAALYLTPFIVGAFAALGAFMASSRVGASTVPVWVTALGIVLLVPTAYAPIHVFKAQYHRRARVELTGRVNAVTRLPHLPAWTPECVSVRIGDVVKTPVRKIHAFLESDDVFELTANVNLGTADLVGGVNKMQRTIAVKAAADPLAAMLAGYEAFNDRPPESFELDKIKKPGLYLGRIVLPLSVAFDVVVSIGDKVTCRFDANSHMRARTIPQVQRLWTRYDPSFDGTCRDVELLRPIDKTHLNAEASMANDMKVPIILEISDPEDPQTEVRVLLRFREAAVVKINESLQVLDQQGRRESIERCIDVDQKKELRAGEYSARALFPESDPKPILVTHDGYDVAVRARAYHVLRQARKSKPIDGWSLLVPRHFQMARREEFRVSCSSEGEAVRLVLETRNINEYAGFDLETYCTNERKKWAETHAGAPPRPIEAFGTVSGVAGRHYVVAKDRGFRAKWFFLQGADLAVITVTTSKAQDHTEQLARTLVSTLRYKDRRTTAPDAN